MIRFFLFFIFSSPLFAESTWRFQNTINLTSQGLSMVCSAKGRDLEFARSKAIEKCKKEAADYLVKSHNFLVVEQKLDAQYKFLRRLSKKVELEGLECHPKRDIFRDNEYWVDCYFAKPGVKVSRQIIARSDFSQKRVVTQLAIRPECKNVYVLSGDVDIYPCDGSFVNIKRPTGEVLIVVASEKYVSKKYVLAPQGEFYDIKKIDLWD